MAHALEIPVALHRSGNVLNFRSITLAILLFLRLRRNSRRCRRMELGLEDLDFLLVETFQTSSLAIQLGMILDQDVSSYSRVSRNGKMAE
jgi:hypothetical protein